MTALAWDGTTLAADRQMTHGTTILDTTKIQRILWGSTQMLVGYTGDVATGEALLAWARDSGLSPGDFPDAAKNDQATLVVVQKAGLLIYTTTPFPLRRPIELPFAAGAGTPYVMAALYCGKNSFDAVKIANLLCTECGGGVDAISFLPDL